MAKIKVIKKNAVVSAPEPKVKPVREAVISANWQRDLKRGQERQRREDLRIWNATSL